MWLNKGISRQYRASKYRAANEKASDTGKRTFKVPLFQVPEAFYLMYVQPEKGLYTVYIVSLSSFMSTNCFLLS